MTSTVLDVGVFLLLASAAMLALVAVDDPVDRPSPDVDVLATTATVTFGPPWTDAIGSEQEGTSSDGTDRADRRVHGSLRELLATAAVASAGPGDAVVDPAGAAFARAVEREVATRVGSRTQVIASWQPVRESDFGGTLVVGSEPPSDRPVRTAVVAVPTPFSTATATEPASIRAFASAFVAARFPVDGCRAALVDGDGRAVHVASRYRHAAAVVLEDESAVANATPAAANDEIARGLAETLSTGSIDGGSAGSIDRVGPSKRRDDREIASVRIVVRRW